MVKGNGWLAVVLLRRINDKREMLGVKKERLTGKEKRIFVAKTLIPRN